MQYHKKVLPNGLRVITVPMKDNPTVTVLVLVEAGSKYETKEKNGISHFLEHMCFKGTARRPSSSDISTELDNVGSHYNAFTSQEYTGYYAKAEYRYLDELLDVVSDMYLNPLFDENEIRKEKGVIIEEINMYEDLPQRKVQLVFEELLYGNQPAGWNIAGSKENIKNIIRDDFVNYRKKFYTSHSTTVVVSGNVKEGEVVRKVEKIFSQVPELKRGKKLKVKDTQLTPAVALFKKETDQVHLILGVRSFDAYDKRNSVLDVLAGVLSGGMSARLFKKMRDEMGICYYVRANADKSTDCGNFSISAGVDSKRVKEAVAAIIAELNKLRTEVVSPLELKKVKQHLIGTMYLGLESSDSLAEFFGSQEIINKPIRTADEIKKEIEAVTAKKVQALAKQLFIDKNLNLAIVGRFESKADFESILKF